MAAAASSSSKRDDTDEAAKEKEMADLLTRLKEATAVPEHAARRVRKLDKMVAYLRKAKKQVDDAVAEDEARLRRLDAEEAELKRIVARITAHKSTMEAERDDIQRRLQAGEKGFTSFVSSTSATTRQTSRKQSGLQRKTVSEELRVSRGYSVDKDAKPHLEVPESILAKAKALARRAPGLR